MMPITARLATTVAALALLGSALLALPAHAQVYRIVGADGKVTFSDKPPAPSSNARVSTANTGTAGGSDPSAGLPYEIKLVATKFPVTLFTGNECAPCVSGRNLLIGRGIPFVEKTVITDDDNLALQRLSGDVSLPFLTIGGQQIKGFSDAEWTQYLNAAGYPPSSMLPPSYRRPAAAALVAVTKAQAPATKEAVKPAAPVAPVTPANNPAGIQF